MLHHDNNILCFVNLKTVVVFHHKKVKYTNYLFNFKCIFAMAESDKTVKKEVNLSNNTRNNSVPTIVQKTSGTVHSDTHPSHQAVVSEPSTLKRKQTSFQITSVTVKGSRLSTDGGEDSADDLDESHTEDANSENLDCSRTTDLDNDPLSEDHQNYEDVSVPAPSIPVTSKVLSNTISDNVHSEVLSKSDACEAAQGDFVKSPNLPDQWQHRFRVVKIVSSEPFKRGRWVCMDFMDPPAPVTEAKAEIIESSSSNIQLIAKSLPDSIPSDKIAHIYEISPSEAYPGSMSVAVGSDHVQQPMYGIFLPINNGQYPLITGLPTGGVTRPIEKEVKPKESSQPILTDVGQPQSKKLTPPMQSHQPSAMQQSMNAASAQQIPNVSLQNIGSNMQPSNVGVPTQQTTSNISQQQLENNRQSHINSGLPMQISSSNMQMQHNMSNTMQQQGFQQNQHSSIQLPVHHSVPQTIPVTLQQSQTSLSQQTTMNQQQVHNIASNVQTSQVATILQQPQQLQRNSMPQSSVSTSMAQSQPAGVTIQQSQVSTLPYQVTANVQQPSQNSMMIQQPSQVAVTMQQPSQVSVTMQQPSQVSVTMQQPSQVPITMQQPSQVPLTMQQPSQVSLTMQQPPQVSATMQQPQQIPLAMQLPQQIPFTMQQSENNSKQHPQYVQAMPQQMHMAIQQMSAGSMSSGMQTPPQQLSINLQHQSIPSQLSQAASMHQQNVSTNVQQQQMLQHQNILPNIIPNVPSPQHTVASTKSNVESHIVGQVLQKTIDSPVQQMNVGEPHQFSNQLSHDIPESHQSTAYQSETEVKQMPESSDGSKSEALGSSQVVPNHVETRESPLQASIKISQEVPENQPAKTDVNGEDSDNVSSGTNTVAIDNKIEQAMDLVKSHLMFAVREEVDVLKEKITELMDRINQLEYENTFLKANASQQTLEQLTQTQFLQQQQQQQQQLLQQSSASVPAVSNATSQQVNIQSQQPTS